MIFNRFFRSKHLDPNPHVRIKAIDKLNKELANEKTVLHELAFNDPDAAVSLAALQKLDSFTLWYKMSEISKDERVLKKSQQIVEQMLFEESNIALSEKDKSSFIRQCGDNKLLEKSVFLPWVQADTNLIQTLLAKVAKPLLVKKVLLETNNTALQSALLNKFKDEASSRKLLNKLLKKSDSEQIKQQVTDLLLNWDKQQQLPISVEKDTKMLLSRLLALKESGDLTVIHEQQGLLSKQYAELSAQFLCLTELKRQEFEQKWLELNQRLQKSIDVLSPQWQEQKAQQQLKQAIAELQGESTKVLDAANAILAERMVELTNTEVEFQGEQLNQLDDKVKSLLQSVGPDKTADRSSLESINGRIIQCQENLANLPEFMLCLSQSKELIEQFAALSLPNDISQIDAAEQYLREVKQQWRAITQRFSKNLPADLVEQLQKATLAWQVVVKKLSEQVNQDVARCRNKYRAIEGLISQGRFRPAIDVYNKVSVWYQKLPENQQAKLNKLHTQVKQQIEDLKDLQEYLAAPRKPALLTDAEYLVSNPLDVEQQAKAVKVLRQQWNSLGVIDSESDIALNQAFDETIERAFAPCRAHYEQQQTERIKNLQIKTDILTQLEQLNNTVGDSGQISKKLAALQQQWRAVGEVEFSLRNSLYEQFQEAIKPLKAKVSDFYKDNAEQKERLISKAKKQLEADSIEEAINQIKSLQVEWKVIAHAGKKAEAELWPAFRRVCDDVFTKRNELIEQQTQVQIQQVDDVQQQLIILRDTVANSTNKAEFEQASELKSVIVEQLSVLPHKERTAFERKLEELEKQVVQGIAQLAVMQTQRQYMLILKVLEQWQQLDTLPADFADLPNSWQQVFSCQAKKSSKNRQELTVMLEIVKEQPSPPSDAAIRQTAQMQLMAQKLQDGTHAEADELLQQWINLGPVTVQEQPLLKRIECLFTQ
jgi:exonuclease SbcC